MNRHDTRAPAQMGLRELLAEDFATHGSDALSPGLWALAAHRLGRRAQRLCSPLARRGAGAVCRALSLGVDVVWGIQLPLSVEVGRRVHLWHHGSMLLHARSIGDEVHIRQCTTLGPLVGVTSDARELPVIDAGADLGAGVSVLGPVVVGASAQVGANTLVLADVPPNTAALGVPARIIPDFGRTGSAVRP
jgi:serine O-acetyltransferase